MITNNLTTKNSGLLIVLQQVYKLLIELSSLFANTHFRYINLFIIAQIHGNDTEVHIN